MRTLDVLSTNRNKRHNSKVFTLYCWHISLAISSFYLSSFVHIFKWGVWNQSFILIELLGFPSQIYPSLSNALNWRVNEMRLTAHKQHFNLNIQHRWLQITIHRKKTSAPIALCGDLYYLAILWVVNIPLRYNTLTTPLYLVVS